MNKVEIGRIYRHFKGDYCIVEDIVIHSESKDKMVLYRELYDDGKRYVRPLDMFISPVDREKYPDVEQEYRFQLQDIESVATKFKK